MVKKKKESKALPQKQKSRAKYPYLPELKELIYQANLVPRGTITPEYEYEVRKEIQRLTEENDGEPPEFSTYEFLTNLIKHLPKDFLDYLKNTAYDNVFPLGENTAPADDRRFRGEFIKQYIEYCYMRDSMLWLVQRVESERQRMREVEAKRQLEKGSVTFEHYHLLDWDAFPLSIKTVVKRNDSGKLHITGLAALIGEFDDSRLQRCVICQRIFWAKREDSKTCSPGCLNKLNVRRHRNLTDEEKAEKKAQRDANRERNKKLKQLKEKKNGTL